MLKNTLTANSKTKDICELKKEIADAARIQSTSQNIYGPNNRYTSSHPNATVERGAKDDPLNKKGKGTGSYMDTSKGGGTCDVNGRSDLSLSGRVKLLAINKFNPNFKYDNNNCLVNL